MHRVTTVVLSVICVALLGVATNVATGALPERWAPYLWLAWPLLGLLVLVLVVVEVARAGERPPANAARAGRARRVLLERVRRYWVSGVLDRSLYQEARIELGITATADDRRHPWTLRARERGGRSRTVDARTSMVQLFSELDRSMVILGAPGAGKTTLLLELARDLLDQADTDPEAPIPVVVNLASWALHRRPLADWLVEQLTERYGIPADQAAAWIGEGEILPLLDGLDEVAEAHRDACAAAIAAFHAAQPLTPFAVCCRTAEYDQLARHPPAYGTVQIQPLIRGQVEQFIERAGDGLTGLRAALAADPGLWDFADSPLLLSIMALAYADGPDPVGDDGTPPRERLFRHYVGTMLRQRSHRSYRPEDTVHYLSQLAGRLRSRQQTVFYLDSVNETWLPHRPHRLTADTISRFAATLLLGLIVAPAGWLLLGATGLAAASAFGLVAVAAMLGNQYDNLYRIDRLFRRFEEEQLRYRGDWLFGPVTSLRFLVRHPMTVARVLSASTWLGAVTAATADGPRPWLAGAGQAAGFLLSAVITLVVVDTASLSAYGPELNETRHELPSPLIRHRLRVALRVAGPVAALSGLLGGQLAGWSGSTSSATRFGVLLALGSGLLALLLIGLAPLAEQWIVRRRLARRGVLPRPLLPFLDHAVQCLFLRQAGAGYLFAHRELLDHFAERDQDPSPAARPMLFR